MAGWASNTFSALGNRHFRVLWTGTLLAFIAFFTSTVVQSVVAFDLAGNNSAVGFVVFGQGLAQLLLGPLGGALADRLSKKAVILACQAAITACFVVLAVLVGTDLIKVSYLAAGSFVIGTAFSFLGPARQAFSVELVGPDQRGNAIALSQVALNASRIIGPLIAGVFISIDALGAAGAFYGMAVLYLGAMWATFAMPPSRPAFNASGRSVLGDIGSGLAYVRRTPRLRLLIISYVLIIMFGFGYITVLPGLLENALDKKASTMTLLLGINAVGGLAASIGVAALADSPRARVIYGLMCTAFGLALVAMGFAPSYAVLAGVMFVVGFGSGGFQTLNGAIVSHTTEPEYFGRVMSLTFLAFATSSVLALPLGAVADAAGERATMIGSGVLVCIVTAAFWMLERALGSAEATEANTAEAASAAG